MITRCCKWCCHKYCNDEKLDASHLGVVAGLHLSPFAEMIMELYLPESAGKLAAGYDPTYPGVPGTAILALNDFEPGFLQFRRRNNYFSRIFFRG